MLALIVCYFVLEVRYNTEVTPPPPNGVYEFVLSFVTQLIRTFRLQELFSFYTKLVQF